MGRKLREGSNPSSPTNIMKPFYIKVEPVLTTETWEWCKKPYPLHRHGCPNYGKKDGCPPNVSLLWDVLVSDAPVYAIFNVFDFGSHVQRMRDKHPNWSDRQCRCCLYWQPKARKQLREKIVEFLKAHRGLFVVKNPEASGVNLTATMKKVGVELEWPPQTVTYQIVLAGTKISK